MKASGISRLAVCKFHCSILHAYICRSLSTLFFECKTHNHRCEFVLELHTYRRISLYLFQWWRTPHQYTLCQRSSKMCPRMALLTRLGTRHQSSLLLRLLFQKYIKCKYWLTVFALFINFHSLLRLWDGFQRRLQLFRISRQPHTNLIWLDPLHALCFKNIDNALFEVRIGMSAAHLSVLAVYLGHFAL